MHKYTLFNNINNISKILGKNIIKKVKEKKNFYFKKYILNL